MAEQEGVEQGQQSSDASRTPSVPRTGGQRKLVVFAVYAILAHGLSWLLKEEFAAAWWVVTALVCLALVPVLLLAPVVAEKPRPWPPLLGLGILGMFFSEFVVALSNVNLVSPWGRPLRIRGKEVYPELSPGDAWANGPAPHVASLDDATRLALATLWHHDAQKEHASVPAFARIAWTLVGLGAGPELVRRCHVAAMQEIDHAERCFAVAGAYSGCPQGPLPMPELLRESPSYRGSVLTELLLETLRDGCLVEDFNADVAEAAAAHATDPAIVTLTNRIARDERDHAALAWEILAWGIPLADAKGRAKLRRAAETLPSKGPVPFAPAEAAIVAAAAPHRLREHGRVPPEEWPILYDTRVKATRRRALQLMERWAVDRTIATEQASLS